MQILEYTILTNISRVSISSTHYGFCCLNTIGKIMFQQTSERMNLANTTNVRQIINEFWQKKNRPRFRKWEKEGGEWIITRP